MLSMLGDQIEKLRGQVAEIRADVVSFRYFLPEMTQRVKTLEQERQDMRTALEELRQKVETQAALIAALQKPQDSERQPTA